MQKFTFFRNTLIFSTIIAFAGALALISPAQETLPAGDSAGGSDTLVPVTKPDIAFATKKNAEENENCLQCHGQGKYRFYNREAQRIIPAKMYHELIINRSQFYGSTHGNFKCIDCHSEDYQKFPHPGNLRMEAMPLCIDCHGGDEQYAKFNFEGIEKDFMESVHREKLGEDFNCWQCHNPHTYKVMARSDTSIGITIAYDNAICLNCHGNISNFQLLSDKESPNLIQRHEWLPNQKLHFASVRCIECHTIKMNDSTLVVHKINAKDKAVRECEKCHSTNSELMARLYKYKVKEVRSAKGFFSGVLNNEQYVIGANRNYYLNVISLIIFGLTIAGITIHAILRVTKK